MDTLVSTCYSATMYRDTVVEDRVIVPRIACYHAPEDRRIYTATHPTTEWCQGCGKIFE